MSSVISAAAFDRLPGPVRAAIWTVLSALCMVGFSSIAKHLADDLPVPAIIFSRGLFGIPFLIPWILRVGRAGFRTQRPLLVTARGLNNLIGLFLVFWRSR